MTKQQPPAPKSAPKPAPKQASTQAPTPQRLASMVPPVPQPHSAYSAYGYTYQPKKRSKALIVFIVLLAICVVCGAGYALYENVLAPKKVALIHVNGTIGQDAGANNPEGLLSLLQQVEGDSTIAAVVLRVDSGGGYSSDGEEMAQYVKACAKPVVVSSGATNASAAYLISSQADYIYANKSSAVGSIGTIMQFMDYSQLLTMLGIKPETIASSPEKDSSYGTRPLTQEEIAHYQDQVDQINQVFIESVAQGRNLNVEDVKKLANGTTFTGEDAVGNRLVDEIGTLDTACEKAASLAGISGYRIITLGATTSYDNLLQLLQQSSNPTQDFLKVLQNKLGFSEASSAPAQ